MNQSPFTNHCLPAIRSVVDSCFPFSVIYICKRYTDGALGLIVNKTTVEVCDTILSSLGVKPEQISIKSGHI